MQQPTRWPTSHQPQDYRAYSCQMTRRQRLLSQTKSTVQVPALCIGMASLQWQKPIYM